jgi:hypothetical protein
MKINHMAIKRIKISSLLCLLLILGSCAPKGHPASTSFKYNISGIIEGSNDGDTVLLGVIGNSKRINTAIIKDSKFNFKGISPELSMAFIQYRYSFEMTGKFVLEDTPVFIKARLKPEDPDYAIGEIIKGGKQNQYLQELNKLQEPGRKEMGDAGKKISKAQNESNTEEEQIYQIMNSKASEKLRLIGVKYIKDHPDAIAGLYFIYDHYRANSLETNLTILNLFDDRIKKTSLWSRVKNAVENGSKNAAGN